MPSSEKPTVTAKVRRKASRRILEELGHRLWAGEPVHDVHQHQWTITIHSRGLPDQAVVGEVAIDPHGNILHISSREEVQARIAEIRRGLVRVLQPGGEECPATKVSEVKPRTKRRFVLIIAVSEYADQNLRLPGVRRDAERLRSVLESHADGGVHRMVWLTDEKATKQNILRELRKISEQVAATDQLIVYFAGHGSRKWVKSAKKTRYYLIPHDGSLADPTRKGLATDCLGEELSKIHAQELVVILDCCRSGGIGAFPWTEDVLQEATEGWRNHYVIASTRGREEAGEDDGGGFFTQAFCDALEGKGVTPNEQGQISVQMAWSRAADVTRAKAARHGVQQSSVTTGPPSAPIYLTRVEPHPSQHTRPGLDVVDAKVSKDQGSKPGSPSSSSPEQDQRQEAHRVRVLEEVTSLLRELNKPVADRIEEKIRDLPRNAKRDPGPEPVERFAFLAHLMVDRCPVEKVGMKLVQCLVIDNPDPPDRERVGKLFDWLLPLNYRPELLHEIRQQVRGGMGIVAGKADTMSLAEILMAGFDQKPAQFVRGTGQDIPGRTALAGEPGPVVGPEDLRSPRLARRLAVHNLLRDLLALTDQVFYRQDRATGNPSAVSGQNEADLERKIKGDAESLLRALRVNSEVHERTIYCVLELPDKPHEREFTIEVLGDVYKLLGSKLLFVDIPPEDQEGTSAPDLHEYVRLRLVHCP